MGRPRTYNDDWIISNYHKYPYIKDLVAAYNKQFNDNLTRRVLACHCERKLGLTKDRQFTDEQDKWLIENFSKLGRKETVRRFNELFKQNRTEGAIHTHANKALGIKISKEDRFAHSSIGQTKYSDGHEIETSNGYAIVKCGGKYVTKGRYIYEKAYGKIPKGNSIVFLDGDNTNYDINNLICVPNSYIRAIVTQRYSPIIKKTENVSPATKRKINREIIKMYELEKTLEKV